MRWSMTFAGVLELGMQTYMTRWLLGFDVSFNAEGGF